MFSYYADFWRKYFKFTGLTNRIQYWYACMWNFIIYLLLCTMMEIGSIVGNGSNIASKIVLITSLILLGLFSLLIMIPHLSMTFRRLRDVGFPWWVVFIGLTPYVGIFILFVFMLLPSRVISTKDNTDVKKDNVVIIEDKHVSATKLKLHIWMPIFGLTIAIIGNVICYFGTLQNYGISLISLGVLLEIFTLFLYSKAKHFFTLLALVLSITALNISLITYEAKQYDKAEKSSAQHEAYKKSHAGSGHYDTDDGTDTTNVTYIKQYSEDEVVPVAGNETVKVNSVKKVSKGYIAVNITITNNSSGIIGYTEDNFEISNGKSDAIMTSPSSVIAEEALGSDSYYYLTKVNINPGESLSRDLLFNSKDFIYANSDSKDLYLVINIGGRRFSAIKLDM